MLPLFTLSQPFSISTLSAKKQAHNSLSLKPHYSLVSSVSQQDAFHKTSLVRLGEQGHLSSSDPKPPSSLMSTLQAFASSYKPRQVSGYQIHNEFFNPLTSLDSFHLEALANTLEAKKSFEFETNPETGLVATSDTQNDYMRRQWFTDSCMVGFRQRQADPQGWRQSMLTNAAALCSPAAKLAVNNAVMNPDWFRKGDIMQGVFHIYYPSSVKKDSEGVVKADAVQLDHTWFNQKRIESQALMLFHLTETLRAGNATGANEPQPWGFTTKDLAGKSGDQVFEAVTNMARYLKAIHTNPRTGRHQFNAPSSSSWEEAPFPNGMTWDTALTVLAFERLQKALYKDPETPSLKELREMVAARAPELSEESLNTLIEEGRHFVNQRIAAPMEKSQRPVQTPERPTDTSLSLLGASAYRFDPNDPLKDALIRYKLLTSTKYALLGHHGMIRYPEFELEGRQLHDSYLNAGFHLPASDRMLFMKRPSMGSGHQYGSTDASSIEALEDRQALSDPQYAAQWGLGLSATLQGLAQVKHDVLQHVASHPKDAALVAPFLGEVNKELLDTLNRNIAAIPGRLNDHEPAIRADGSPCPPYKPLEAYEAVPNKDGHLTFIPGAHTLPWHASQLFDGLQKTLQAQRLEEKMARDGLLSLPR
jgi:hypothetical protein